MTAELAFLNYYNRYGCLVGQQPCTHTCTCVVSEPSIMQPAENMPFGESNTELLMEGPGWQFLMLKSPQML